MSEHGTGPRGGRMRRLVLAVILAFAGPVIVAQTAAADEPPVPENVAAYFATGLIPRLAELYGSAGSSDPETTFDDTTTVGTIHRLLAWTPEFLAGQKTDNPTELTNTWIAPVTAKSGLILGLAAVWINPGSDAAELADFARGRALVDALGRAPKNTQFIDDTVQQAWFATDGTTLTPLVAGTSGTTGPLTIAEYQKILRSKTVQTKPQPAPTNPGLLIAGITLGAVVLLLAVFILLPARKRKGGAAADAPAVPRRNPRGDSERAFDREASSTEARAISLARAAVSAEAGLVDAMADAADRVAAHTGSLHAVDQGHAQPTPEETPIVSAGGPTPKGPTSKGSAEKKAADEKPAQRKPTQRKTAQTKSAPEEPAPEEPISEESAQRKPPQRKSAQRNPARAGAAPNSSAPGDSVLRDSVSKQPATKQSAPAKATPTNTARKKPSTAKPAAAGSASEKPEPASRPADPA